MTTDQDDETLGKLRAAWAASRRHDGGHTAGHPSRYQPPSPAAPQEEPPPLMPPWPAHDSASTADLIGYYAAAAVAAAATWTELIARSCDTRATAHTRALRDAAYERLTGAVNTVHLLRALHAAAPAAAHTATRDLLALHLGGSFGEWAWVWAAEAGIDPAPIADAVTARHRKDAVRRRASCRAYFDVSGSGAYLVPCTRNDRHDVHRHAGRAWTDTDEGHRIQDGPRHLPDIPCEVWTQPMSVVELGDDPQG